MEMHISKSRYQMHADAVLNIFPRVLVGLLSAKNTGFVCLRIILRTNNLLQTSPVNNVS